MLRIRIRITLLAILLSGGVSTGYCSGDARVATVLLDPNGVTQIPVCSGYVTTVLFPRPVSGIVGYGLTSDPASEEGSIQYAHPGDSGLVTLRVLKADLRVAYMTVLTGDDLYNFALVNSPGQAALSVKLTERDRQVGQPEPGSIQLVTADAQPSASPVPQVTNEDVVNARPVYHPEKLRTLLELAKEAPLLQESSPELYKGYEERKVSNVSNYGDVIATVQEVHRFPADDAIVLFGEIQNKSVRPITFDPAAITIGIGDRQYPSAFVDCAPKVDAETAIKFAIVGQGDLDGSRAHLALRNTFRIQLPNFQAAATPSPTPPEPAKRPIAHRSLIEKRLLAVSGHRKGAAKPSPSPAKENKWFLWPWSHAQASPSPTPRPIPKKG
jgi:hypothetical protein